jgi:hypothetical protein
MNNQEIKTVAQQNPELAEKGARAFQSVLARSATDPEFRQRLLTNPHQAIPEVTGQPLPADYQVVFLENKADATFVLPDPVSPHAELNEAELEAVSGGCSPATVVSILSVGYIVYKTYEAVKEISDN